MLENGLQRFRNPSDSETSDEGSSSSLHDSQLPTTIDTGFTSVPPINRSGNCNDFNFSPSVHYTEPMELTGVLENPHGYPSVPNVDHGPALNGFGEGYGGYYSNHNVGQNEMFAFMGGSEETSMDGADWPPLAEQVSFKLFCVGTLSY